MSKHTPMTTKDYTGDSWWVTDEIKISDSSSTIYISDVSVSEDLAKFVAHACNSYEDLLITLELAWGFIEAVTSDDPAYSSHIEPSSSECSRDCPLYLRERISTTINKAKEKI